MNSNHWVTLVAEHNQLDNLAKSIGIMPYEVPGYDSAVWTGMPNSFKMAEQNNILKVAIENKLKKYEEYTSC